MIEQFHDRRRLLRRSLIFSGMKFIFLSTIIGRIYKLQVIDSKKYKTLADENRINLMIHMPIRGEIYDKEGAVIAYNHIEYSLNMTPALIEDIDSLIIQLNEFIELNSEDISLIKNIYFKENSLMPHIIKVELSWNQVAKVSTNLLKLEGIEIKADYIRSYPAGNKYFHIVGYTANANKKEVTEDPFYSYPGMYLGKSGIESACEKFLRGFPGTEEVEVNSKGKIIRQLSMIKSIKGSDVYLTVNSSLQDYTMSRLKNKIGAAVIIDPKNGNIISSVSNPSFDPNIFSRSMSKNTWDEMSKEPNSPFLNKVVQGLYPPGSIFKILIALTALKYGVISNKEKIFCNGKYSLGNQEFHCWKKNGHSNVDLIKAIAESCDNYFYEVSLRLGIEKIHKEAKVLGIGKQYKNFIQQAKGIVPNKVWKKNKYGESWQQGETLITGIGQGFVLLTPLEMAIMTSTIVNGGKIIRPNIITTIKGSKENIEMHSILDNAKSSYYKEEHLNLVKKGMFNVVNNISGTAWKSRIDDKTFLIGGKTGTSQVRKISLQERESGIIKNEDLPWDKRDHALFVGFAPYEKPKFVTAVLIVHGGSGSKAAAPIGRDLLVASREIMLGEKTIFKNDSVKENS